MGRSCTSYEAEITGRSRKKTGAKKKGIHAQEVLQIFMFERIIERLSVSPYKDRFILKGWQTVQVALVCQPFLACVKRSLQKVLLRIT